MTQPAAPAAPATGAPASTDPAGTEPATGTPPETPPAGQSETDTTDWKAEAEKAKADMEKWKAHSRKNENDLKAERDKASKANMTADEKAIADAKAEGRKSASVELGKKLAMAEFKAAAAAKQIDLTDILDDLDVSRYVDETGEVDNAAITKAVAKFAKLAKPSTAGKSGGEFNGGSGAGQPITEEQLANMSPSEMSKAYAEGKLKHLM